MNYYQARISIETARLLEKMRIFYEKKTGGTITKGECLIRAFEDSRWVEDETYNTSWKNIHDTPLPPVESDYEVSQTAQMLKIQVTNDVKEGIQNLKEKLRNLLGLRSVTVGVCIREILKAAYLKNQNFYKEKNQKNISNLTSIFNSKKEFVLDNFDTSVQKEILLLLEELEKEIKTIKWLNLKI